MKSSVMICKGLGGDQSICSYKQHYGSPNSIDTLLISFIVSKLGQPETVALGSGNVM